jgi:Winged helix-turn-helix domain (DUF2582)
MAGNTRKCVSTLGYFLAGLGIGGVLSVLVFSRSVENGTKNSFAKANLKGGYMQEEIGTTADAIWKILHTKGEFSLSQLKKQTKAKTRVFDWAIGWLARENKIAFTKQKRSIRVRLI